MAGRRVDPNAGLTGHRGTEGGSFHCAVKNSNTGNKKQSITTRSWSTKATGNEDHGGNTQETYDTTKENTALKYTREQEPETGGKHSWD